MSSSRALSDSIGTEASSSTIRRGSIKGEADNEDVVYETVLGQALPGGELEEGGDAGEGVLCIWFEVEFVFRWWSLIMVRAEKWPLRCTRSAGHEIVG